MKVKRLIEELQKLDGEKNIGVGFVIGGTGLIVIQHIPQIDMVNKINNYWTLHELNKINDNDCDYILR